MHRHRTRGRVAHDHTMKHSILHFGWDPSKCVWVQWNTCERRLLFISFWTSFFSASLCPPSACSLVCLFHSTISFQTGCWKLNLHNEQQHVHVHDAHQNLSRFGVPPSRFDLVLQVKPTIPQTLLYATSSVIKYINAADHMIYITYITFACSPQIGLTIGKRRRLAKYGSSSVLRFSKDYPGQVESKPSLKRKYSNPQNQSTERFQMCYHPTGHKTNGSVIHQAAIPCQLSGPCRIRRLLAWHGLCREKPPPRGRLTKPVDVWFEHIGNNLVVGSDGI